MPTTISTRGVSGECEILDVKKLCVEKDGKLDQHPPCSLRMRIHSLSTMLNSSSSLPVELSSREGSLSPRRRTRGRGEQGAGLCGGRSGGRAPAPVGVVDQRKDTAEYEGGGGEGSEGEARGQGLVSAVRGGGEDPGGHGWEEHTGGAERGQILNLK